LLRSMSLLMALNGHGNQAGGLKPWDERA
jgi:hypothetical protein